MKPSKYLNFPVVSGNVSFHNETKDKGIKAHANNGGVGLLLGIVGNMITMKFKEMEIILYYVIGKTEGHLHRSIFAKEYSK